MAKDLVSVTLTLILKVLVEWIQFYYFMVTLFVQNDMKKKNERKTRSEKEISMKTKSFNDSAKGSALSEWCCIPFYEVIGNIAGNNKRWRQRQFEPLQEKGV